MAKNWKKETARDLMALGSIPFVILVLVRAVTVENFRMLFYMVVAVLLLYLISFKMKDIEHHTARLVIVGIFLTIFYASYVFAVFALLVGITALYGLRVHLKKERVYRSAFLGVVCSVISYLIAIPFNIPNL